MSRHLHGIGMTSQRTRDRLVQRLRDEGISDLRVLEVMRRVPRHIFVDEALSSRAYEDTALPIGYGQTISQPYIVARMTEVLLARTQGLSSVQDPVQTPAQSVPRRVLEIGTGCGYQTAVLASLVEQVYSVERIAALLESARARLRTLGLHNVQLRHSDGSMGWPQQGPFDGIIVAAAAQAIPDELLAQLAEGGRLVIPVGTSAGQTLELVVREGNEFVRQTLERVSFVPLLGGAV